jgi:hypothetical protein
MDVKTTFRNLVRDQSVSICMLQFTSSLSFETNVISEKLALSANKCFLKIKNK